MVATGEEAGKESLLGAPTSLFLLQTPLPTTEGGLWGHLPKASSRVGPGSLFPQERGLPFGSPHSS